MKVSFLRVMTLFVSVLVVPALSLADEAKAVPKDPSKKQMSCDSTPSFACRSTRPVDDKFIFVTGMLCLSAEGESTLFQTASVARVIVINSESKLIDQTIPMAGFYEINEGDEKATPVMPVFHFYLGMSNRLPQFTMYANFVKAKASYININKVKLPVECAYLDSEDDSGDESDEPAP